MTDPVHRWLENALLLFLVPLFGIALGRFVL